MSDTGQTMQLQRKLGARHLNMIAIGGSIGTGLFLASGATIANAGPGGALLAYVLIGVMIYFLMTSLGELATHNPTSGAFLPMVQNMLKVVLVLPWVGTIGITGPLPLPLNWSRFNLL